MRKSVKRAVVIGTTLAVAGVAGAAYASWTASGNGLGGAKADTVKPLTVESATTADQATLFPGGTGDVVIKVTNPNQFAVDIHSVQWKQSDGVQTTSAGSCGNNGVYFGDYATSTSGNGGLISGLDLKVGANGDATFTLPKAVKMLEGTGDECQGATFSMKLTVNGVSVAPSN
ncbi:hypothetical protein [Actinoplanes sp. NPDC051411]|uniref:hypothetical protein n=1 Tax=Actinoplanes sp. NPDC051411 TaxID=3155522 RepID=UPI00342A197B